MKKWFAPAKLNLFLHVLGRREDGYHNLQTLYQLLDFGDSVEINVRNDNLIFRIDNSDLPDNDLSVRAARLLQNITHTSYGAEITLKKKIPIGAGLGGGSSNAATTLLALNNLWNTGLSLNQLSDIGRELGADIPFFIGGHSAWGEGIGDILTPVILPKRYYCLIWPKISVSTQRIFSEPELTRNTPPIRIPSSFEEIWGNDLESVVRKKVPEVDKCLDWLGQFGRSQMTGSGSAVFVVVPDVASGQSILERLPASYQGLLAQGINKNPDFFVEPVGV